MVAVYGEQAPSDEEWERYLEMIRGIKKNEGLLIYSWGPGPNMRQRRLLEEAVAHHEGEVAVVTPSRVARGVVKALSWTGKNIRAFPMDATPEAFDYLGFKESQRSQALSYASLLAEELGLHEQSRWLSELSRQHRSAESSARLKKVSKVS